MKKHEMLIISLIFSAFILLLLIQHWHFENNFGGSILGSSLGIMAALLMLIPLFYFFAKRIKYLKDKMTNLMKMSTFLAIHIYGGILGALLAVIHTGDHIHSWIGVTLVVLIFVILISGYIGRYLLSKVNSNIKDKKTMLKELKKEYDHLSEIPGAEQADMLSNVGADIFDEGFAKNGQYALARRLSVVVQSMADLEYAILMHNKLKETFMKWLTTHIFITMIFYAILLWHIVAASFYGIRWFAP